MYEKALFYYFLVEHMFWIFVRISKTYVAWRFYAMFLHNFSLTVTFWAKVSWHLNSHYNEFCRCIECRYKEGWLYKWSNPGKATFMKQSFSKILSQPWWLSLMHVRLVIRRLRVWSHRGQQHSLAEIDHEIFATVILSLRLIQEGQLSVSGERLHTKTG